MAEHGEHTSGARWVEWKHDEPLTGKRGVSSSDAYFHPDEAGERDPLGIAFGPPTLAFPAEGLPDEGGPAVSRGAGVPNGRCVLDGMTVDCADANRLMSHGLLAHAPDTMVRQRPDGTLRPYVAVLGPGGQIYTGHVPAGARPMPYADQDDPFYDGIRFRSGDAAVRLRRDPGTDLPFGFGLRVAFSQNSAQRKPCTFNVNLTNRSGVPLSKANLAAFEGELNSIFGEAGASAVLNKPGQASNAAFNFNLTLYDKYPASYPRSARSDATALGYTPLTRSFPKSAYPDIKFPGQSGGVSVSNIRTQYGRASVAPGALAVVGARVGAHEFITHYLLGQPGHEDDAEGLTREGFDYREEENIFLSDAVKGEINKICATGRLPE